MHFFVIEYDLNLYVRQLSFLHDNEGVFIHGIIPIISLTCDKKDLAYKRYTTGTCQLVECSDKNVNILFDKRNAKAG